MKEDEVSVLREEDSIGTASEDVVMGEPVVPTSEVAEQTGADATVQTSEEEDTGQSSDESMESELDEDDLDLLEHTLGSRKERGFRNLQRKIESESEGEASKEEVVAGVKRKGKSPALENLFDDSEDDDEQVRSRSKPIMAEEEDSDVDDLDDFIEDIDDDEGPKPRAVAPKQSKAPSAKSRFGAGLSKDILQDMLDIFGDGTEYADLVDDHLASEMDDLEIDRKKKKSPVSTEQLDIPERYAAVPNFRPGEFEQETVWVAERLFPAVRERVEGVTVEALVPIVGAVLSMIRDQHLEVPFIAAHRKEYYQQALTLSDLWRCLELDGEWRAFARQCEAFAHFMEQRGQALTTDGVGDLVDLEFFQEYYKQVVRFGASKTSGPLYDEVIPFVRDWAIEPEHFLMNWAMKELKHEASESGVDPLMAAVQFVGGALTDEHQVLRLAKSLCAKELAFHPKTSRMFRTALESVACLNVQPTPLGVKDIGMNHDLAPYKWLTDKPLSALSEDLFLRLEKAKKAGLLKVEIAFHRLEELEREWTDYFCATGHEDWAELRREVLHDAIHEHVLPRVKRILEARLRNASELHVAQGCQFALQSKLMQAPHGQSVVTVSWGEGGPQAVTMAVCVDPNGRVVEHGRFLHLQAAPTQARDEWIRLAEWITELRPSLVIVGGLNVRTVELYEELRNRIRDERIIWGEDDAARIFQASPRGTFEFPEWSPLLRYCVSLARRWINPLLELAALSGEELCKLPLHPGQSLLAGSTELLEGHLKRALVNVTNLVGVEIPAMSSAWQRAPLKYVAGLGVKSAERLAKSIGQVECRQDLAALLQPKVFSNAASFLKFTPSRTEGRSKKDRHHLQFPKEPLDVTRIHPENYPLARKIACDAMEVDMADGESDEDARRAIVSVMEQPERLNDLLLDEYSKELERRAGLVKHLTLLDIKAELQAPYADLRSAVKEAPVETVFEALTGETEGTLFPGQLVTAKVLRLSDRAAHCRLESGLNAYLPLSKLPADETGRYPSHPSKVLRPNQAILASVTDIHLGRFEVGLSMRPDDLKDPKRPRVADYDPYYDHEASTSGGKASRRLVEKPQDPAMVPRRIISHPSYKDISRLEAERLLGQSVLGEVIIRPSASKGPNHLTLTWKVDQGQEGALFQHVDIEEFDRPTGDPNALGRTLKITLADGSKQSFEDLDEIIARFIEPISTYLSDIRACPKFHALNSLDRTGSRTAVESRLATERAKAPGRIAYGLSLSRDRPGACLLSYQPGQKCYHELVDVLPSGYRLRGTSFDRLDALINWFKQNYNRR